MLYFLMKYTITLLLLILSNLDASNISAYTVKHFCLQPQNQDEFAVIRTFTQNNKRLQLRVNTRTLQTAVEPMIKTLGHICNTNSNYHKLLRKSSNPPFPLQNDGIKSAREGTFITTDLCPSSKSGFEKNLYEELISIFPTPVPVTLFITGKWIEKHSQSLQQFIKWQREGKLAITWGNHTYSHPYHSKVPLDKNFALSSGYNLRQDTLRLEKKLLNLGITPSIFFRYPGLVSDKNSTDTIKNLGLITIGSDTWIAKKQQPKQGSIILLHGNKNEHNGITMFLDILHQDKISRPKSLLQINQ